MGVRRAGESLVLVEGVEERRGGVKDGGVRSSSRGVRWGAKRMQDEDVSQQLAPTRSEIPLE